MNNIHKSKCLRAEERPLTGKGGSKRQESKEKSHARDDTAQQFLRDATPPTQGHFR